MDLSLQKQGSNGIFIPLQDQANMEIPVAQPNQPNQIVMNQMMQPKVIYVDSTNFKSKPCDTICPFCKNQIKTQTVKKCDWYSWLLCYCVGILPWITLQCCRNKQLNCFDAEHYCPTCGNKIVEYSSC